MGASMRRTKTYRSGRRAFCAYAVLVGAATALPVIAHAQTGDSYFLRNNNVSVLDRQQPGYEAIPHLIGSFDVLPSVTVAPTYSDNILASSANKQSDLIVGLVGNVQAQSNWSRNALALNAQVASQVYTDHSSENTTDFNLNGVGRLDILSQSNITATAGYSKSTYSRTSFNTFGNSSSPIQYDAFDAGLSSTQVLNRLKFQEGVSFVSTSYDNTTDFSGAPLDLSYLDSDTTNLTLRADYAYSPEVALFVSGVANNRNYGNKTLANSLDRSSNGYEVDLGADFDVSRLVRGQIQVGYLSQSYNSPLFHDVGGAAVHARVEYFPSGLTTVILSANRSVVDAVDPTAISILQTNGSVEVDHELLRNVILRGRLGYETDVFKGENRTDRRPSATLGANYLFNRHISASLTYNFIKADSSGAARVQSYTVNLVSLALTYKF